MRVKPEQLDARLAQGLASVYLLSGDEPLQVMEAADAIRARAREEGFTDRQVLHADKGFDWGILAEVANTLSLFADRRLIDLRVPGKPGQDGAQALAAYAGAPPPDTVLLVTTPKLDKNAQRAKWVQALDGAGVWVQVWPIEGRYLGDWIQRRMRARGLQPGREAVTLLADRVEGNLLAAAQEIEKLALLHGAGRIEMEDVAACVADSARFNVFGLVDGALAGQGARVARMLVGLRGEGVAPLLVAWALGREIRGLAAMAREVADGGRLEAVMAAHRVWERRKPLVGGALRRFPAEHWYGLVEACGRVERVVKGAAVGNPWDDLLQLALNLSGTPLFPAARPA